MSTELNEDDAPKPKRTWNRGDGKKKLNLGQKDLDEVKKIIIDNNLTFFGDIFAYVKYSKKTFYNYFEPEDPRVIELKDMVDSNRTRTKVRLRTRWVGDEASPMLQIAAYRLLGTEEERSKLSTYIKTKDEKVDDGGIGPIKIEIVHSTEDKGKIEIKKED